MKRSPPVRLHLARLLLLPLLLTFAQAAPLTLQQTIPFSGHPDYSDYDSGIDWATLSADGHSVYTWGGSVLIEWDAQTGKPRHSISLPNVRSLDATTERVRVILPISGQEPAKSRLDLLNLNTEKIEARFELNAPITNEPTWAAGQQAVTFQEGHKLWYWAEGMTEPKTLPIDAQPKGFSPDHTILYARNYDVLTAYSTATGEALWELKSADLPGRDGKPLENNRDYWVSSVSPYSPRMLIKTQGGLALFDLEKRTLLAYLDPQFDRIKHIDWSPDGQRLMLSLGNTIHILDATTGKPLSIADGKAVVSQPDASNIWTQDGDYFVRFNLKNGLDEEAMPGKSAFQSPVQVDAAGRPTHWLGYTEKEHKFAIFNPQGQIPLIQHFTRVAHPTPDGHQIASLGEGEMRFLDARTGQQLSKMEAYGGYDFAFSPDGKLLAVGDHLFDIATGKEVAELNEKYRYKAVVGNQFRDTRANVQEAGLRGLARTVTFSPNSKQVAVGYEASAIGIWDVKSGLLTQVLTGGRGWVLSLAYSPDGKTLVSGWGDGTLHFYDPVTGKAAVVQRVNTGFIRWLAYSPDGQQVAAASGDGSASLWTAQGRPIRRLTGHTGAATSVAYLDNNTLVSSDSVGVLRLWDTQSGKLLGQASASDQSDKGALIQSLNTLPKGRLLSSDRDNNIRIYSRP